jgi:hypothetical protein
MNAPKGSHKSHPLLVFTLMNPTGLKICAE